MSKRIVIQDYCGYPFPVQLSRKLAERGHRVFHLYAGNTHWPRGEMQRLETDSPEFDIRGLNTRQPLNRYAFVKRWFQEREYGQLVVDAVADFKPEVVISADMPLDPQAMLLKHCRHHNIRFVFWLQDIISMAAKSILSKKLSWMGALIGNYYLALEKRILANSDHVIAITADFEAFLSDAGVSRDRVTVIPNWAPLDDLPVFPKNNAWARAHGLADKFCFLYSGTLGLKHNPDLLLQLALHFQDNPQVIIYAGSEGSGAEWLKQKQLELDLENLLIMDYQPMRVFSQVLAASDVLVAILEPDAGVYSVPSKILSYLSAQRPLLIAVPPQNLAAQIVSNNQAGYVVAPENVTEYLAKARDLFTDQSIRRAFGSNARRFAEEQFDIEKIADRFEALL